MNDIQEPLAELAALDACRACSIVQAYNYSPLRMSDRVPEELPNCQLPGVL